MVNFNKKYYSMAAAIAVTMGFASCSNELHETDFNKPEVVSNINLVKNPQISAWSGAQNLGTRSAFSTISTRSQEYDWGWPEGITVVENFSVPNDAMTYTGNNQGSGTYKVTAGEYLATPNPYYGMDPGLFFDNNANLNVYVLPGAKVENIGKNISSLNLYISEGAEVTISECSMNGCQIYNAGKLNIPNNFDGSKIQNIYNIGEIYFSAELGSILPDNVSIYNKGGYVEFSYSQEYGQTLINGTIISDNKVKSNGKIKFQSSGKRDICFLESSGEVEFTDGTNIFGQIVAPSMSFDGNYVTLHPNGLVEISGEIKVPNSGSGFKAYNTNSRALVECNSISIPNDPLSIVINDGVFLNATTINAGKSDNNYPYDRINNAKKEDFDGGCGNMITDDGPEVMEPEAPVTYPTKTEVEVNLSINDVHDNNIEDFVTKLSIHVRYPYDVQIRIPIPAQYYLEADDLVILHKHQEELMKYGADHTSAYEVNGKEVTLTVAYDLECITVTTNGVNQDVFDYCVEKYGDGLNFEVYNYFVGRVLNEDNEWVASDLSVEDLQGYLDDSTISFIGEDGELLGSLSCPDYYINAYGNRGQFNGEAEPEGGYIPTVKEDCQVTIISPDQSDYFGSGVKGWHLNNSDKNVIYKNKNCKGPEGEHDHDFLWGKMKQ